MSRSYKVYSQTTPTYNASIYYRVLQPMSLMESMGFPVDPLYDWSDCGITPNQRIAAFMESDIDLLYQTASPIHLDLMRTSAKFRPMPDREGEMRWPPTMIVDTDDDLYNVQPLNLTYGINGVRRPDGTPIEDGDTIGVAHPNEIPEDGIQAKLHEARNGPMPGDRVKLGDQTYAYCDDGLWHTYLELWKDGANCNWANNRRKIQLWTDTLKMANLITCSTPRSEAYVKREIGQDAPTFVAPNAINFSEYPEVELRDHPGEVRILWQGSATHHEDLWPLNASLKRVAEKYPQTTWVFWGAPYTWAIRNIPADRVKLIPWLHFESYKPRLSMIGHDINLAPLSNNIFNDSRSAIKWYESSAIWKPAATLAQNWAAYRDEIQEGETGLLFNTPEEFEEKLGALIESETLRQTLASNAKDWVRTNREAKALMVRLFAKWSEVREGHKLQMPPPPSELELPTEEERTVKIESADVPHVTLGA